MYGSRDDFLSAGSERQLTRLAGVLGELLPDDTDLKPTDLSAEH